jgi:hypothetical protein
MSLATKITALLISLTPAQVRAMAPADRQRLADACEHVRLLAEQQGDTPRGVLGALRRSPREG